MNIIKWIIFFILGFSGGSVISGAVFAFIAIIGVVPRLAQKTKTEKYIRCYENAIITGGIAGTSTLLINYSFPLWKPLVILICFAVGIFYGCLAVSLAEVLDVIPILTRRGGLKKGIKYFVVSIAVGKLIGAILYYYVPGFYTSHP
jgi:stage V sporulation protein AB